MSNAPERISPPGRGALNVQPNISEPDAFYESLITLHQDLTDEQSALVNSKLVLILANHIGDKQVIAEAFELAVRGIQADTQQADTQQADTQQADTQQADTQQADTQQADTGPAEDR